MTEVRKGDSITAILTTNAIFSPPRLASLVAGTESALNFRDNGMYLCSNKITLPHPTLVDLPSPPPDAPYSFHRSDDGRILLSAALPSIPEKFNKLMSREQQRAEKYSSPS